MASIYSHARIYIAKNVRRLPAAPLPVRTSRDFVTLNKDVEIRVKERKKGKRNGQIDTQTDVDRHAFLQTQTHTHTRRPIPYAHEAYPHTYTHTTCHMRPHTPWHTLSPQMWQRMLFLSWYVPFAIANSTCVSKKSKHKLAGLQQ